MTDEFELDDEEPGPVAKSERSGERVFTVVGFLLASAAAFFPWYVFFNQENFGITPMGYADTRDLPEIPGRAMVTVSPLAIPDEKDESAPASAFDPIVTATVPESGGQGSSSSSFAVSADPSQTFPGKPQYRLLHVANGRALIEDKSGMYIVRIGSVLPDNSRLATLEQREGKWVIVTSNGEVIQR
ncbi:MAG: flagellar protein [Hoeflea sp.]|uniref:flagellar protein n=1 Tax=Hoeflea sp. TaxID=1940281 RepID=UPI00272FD44E|nr:flagellar protein [Hoeflea sp.]MDP2119391.1 flagellar protein [Hoeflea sp.]MDP3524957.1 flagellar protein [Hoeflea sp.]MDZ7600153.1 flagellar protein [Hoeflea sp.]